MKKQYLALGIIDSDCFGADFHHQIFEDKKDCDNYFKEMAFDDYFIFSGFNIETVNDSTDKSSFTLSTDKSSFTLASTIIKI